MMEHRKYVCREYKTTVTKWRKRSEDISRSADKLKVHEVLKPKLKLLSRMDESEHVSKNKGKSKETKASNKADVKRLPHINLITIILCLFVQQIL